MYFDTREHIMSLYTYDSVHLFLNSIMKILNNFEAQAWSKKKKNAVGNNIKTVQRKICQKFKNCLKTTLVLVSWYAYEYHKLKYCIYIECGNFFGTCVCILVKVLSKEKVEK